MLFKESVPYGIFKYELNTFCSLVSLKSGTPFHHVLQKPQIAYIHNYLNHFVTQKKKIYFIYENKYIDRHYLEDYTEYYVKCFQNYSKYCTRIHFFLSDEDITTNNENPFLKKIKGEKTLFDKKHDYLGFIIIKPIPETFIARVCFKNYNLKKNTQKVILQKGYKVSLFGITLKVESIAFQEHDKILSACATSAIWSFYQAHPKMDLNSLPSPSKITKSSYPEKYGHDSEFPNSGLDSKMIGRSLKLYGLMPRYYEIRKVKKDFQKNFNLMKEIVYAYCSNGIPMILGVEVNSADKKVTKGLHAVTILGFDIGKKQLFEESSNEIKLKSRYINKLYMHDDRYGPYMRLKYTKKTEWIIDIDGRSDLKEIYIPDTLVLGLYHKIRIPYERIKDTCQQLIDSIVYYLTKKLKDEVYSNAINSMVWDIKLKTVNQLKEELFTKNINNKESYIFKSWPKYIWSAIATMDSTEVLEFVFDATDIDQGSVFLDIIEFNTDLAESLFSVIEEWSNHRFISRLKKDEFTRNPDNNVWSIITFFRKKISYKEKLNELFGPEKIPNRIKNTEIQEDLIKDQCNVRLANICLNFELDKNLDSKYTYIWLIDFEGFLCIGKELAGSQIGHPTLTDGNPARIGGNLKFNNAENVWVIDPFSGRYSKPYDKNLKKEYCTNAMELRFKVYFPEENFDITRDI